MMGWMMTLFWTAGTMKKSPITRSRNYLMKKWQQLVVWEKFISEERLSLKFAEQR